MPSYGRPDGKFQAATSTGQTPAAAVWLAMIAVALAVAEALYQGGVEGGTAARWGWLAGAAGIAAVSAVVAWRHGSRSARSVAVGLVVLMVLLGIGALRVRTVSVAPGRAAVDAAADAAQVRDRTLAAGVAAARRIGILALQRVGDAAPGQTPALADLLGATSIEMGVLVLGGDTVVAVAGPQRVGPSPPGTEAALVETPFSRLMLVTAHRGHRRAQVSLLLDAASALPSPGRSLAGSVGDSRGIGWHWLPQQEDVAAGSVGSVMSAIGGAMQAVPPDAEALLARELGLARRLAVAGLVLLSAIVLLGGAPPLVRALALLLPLWALVRGGLVLEGAGGAITIAVLAGAALLLLTVVLWQRSARRAPVGVIAAVILLAVAPWLVLRTAGQLAPPSGEGTLLAWFGWQAILAVATGAWLALASAPLRTRGDLMSSWRWGAIATVAAVAVALLGIELWSPATVSGWPWWYPVCWLIPFAAMLPVTSPLSRRVAIFTAAASLAALGSWGSSLDTRLADARTDVTRLGAARDSVTEQSLGELGSTLLDARDTRLEMIYATWHDSPVATSRVPTQLAVWVDTTVIDWVALDSMAPSWGDLQRVVAERGKTIEQVPLARGEGRHTVLVVPLDGDTTITVLAGPRSRIVRPTRFGRMIDWRVSADPPYTLHEVRADDALPDFTWRRTGRHIRADEWVRTGGRPLIVRATVSIDEPRPFAVRAALTVLLDVLLMMLLWFLVERFLGFRSGREPEVFRRSYRRTVTAALISFFVVPAAFFTLWSVLRLRQEVGHDRAQEVTRVLHQVDDEPVLDDPELATLPSVALAQVADRLDAEVAIYRSGRLVAASAPLLAELGLVSPVMDPTIVRAGPADERGLAVPIPGANVRVGGQMTTIPGVVMAAALPGGEGDLERDQVDLALLLLLASLGGTIAAVSVAGAVARALAQPIDSLRRRALAIGRRESAPPLNTPPAEFVPVFNAIEQMERDLGQSEARLEEETARTARIVAWGEMARQVAHEIKNPLTPMRLGLQHLQRLGADGDPDLRHKVSDTAVRLLEEIDRLDRIARSFSRYGTPPPQQAGPLETIDTGPVVREVTQLFGLGAGPLSIRVVGEGGPVPCRREELIQVLLNLLDNARQAGANSVECVLSHRSLRVIDDGPGIREEQLERVFEPSFSTTTSGTGLGLAIVRRLVEGWGGSIVAKPADTGGVEMVIDFAGGESASPEVAE